MIQHKFYFMKQFFFVSATFVLCCIAYKNVIAQNSNPVCGWKPLANNFRLTKKAGEPFQKEQLQSSEIISDAVYTLPVVIHVIHTGDAVGSPDNPTTAQINAMILNLNFADANETVLSAYTDTAKKKITIPVTGVVTGVHLRMRVVADNPATPAPTACLLHGTVTEGAGQAEDYSVVVMTAQPVAYKPDKKSPVAQKPVPLIAEE